MNDEEHEVPENADVVAPPLIYARANAFWAILLLPFIVVRRGVIAREERYLERLFGEEYLRYKARVRRWI
jgi:protein-S-isoprenylcysteine O-methyltransferase Ste14